MATEMTGTEHDWFIVWEVRQGEDLPLWLVNGPVGTGSLNPVYGNLTGPFSRKRAEAIVKSIADNN